MFRSLLAPKQRVADPLLGPDLGVDAGLAAWIPHQIALPLIQGIAEAVGVRPFVNGDRYGNTGAASLPIALAEARAEFGNRRVALSALGGGMRWGSALWDAWAPPPEGG